MSFQRLQIAQKVAHRIQTNKISRRQYIQELENGKLVVSSFGYGEIALKDLEVFLTGGLLLKPDMSHLETWPDLFRAGETMVSHRWDLVDFEAVIDCVLEDYSTYIEIARTGQRTYRSHLTNPELFVIHLTTLLASSHGKVPRLLEA